MGSPRARNQGMSDPLSEKGADESPFTQQWIGAKWKELDGLKPLHC